jgi:hypothetical protein
MPIWLWMIMLCIALTATGFSRYNQKAAIRRRREELARGDDADKMQQRGN